jgi:hypothetical protein
VDELVLENFKNVEIEKVEEILKICGESLKKFEFLKNSNIEKISIEHCFGLKNLSFDSCRNLKKVEFPTKKLSLQDVSFKNTLIDDETLNNLIPHLNTTHISNLDLFSTKIGTVNIETLLENQTHFRKIDCLDLSYCFKIDSISLKVKELKELKLQRLIKFNDEKISGILEQIKNNHVESLNLFGCIQVKSPFNSPFPSIKCLDLGQTKITDESLSLISSYFCKNLEKLRLLSCSLLKNPNLSNSNLKSLEFFHCDALKSVKVSSPDLEDLVLSGTLIDDIALNEILKNYSHETSKLKNLSFSQCSRFAFFF